MATPSPHSPPGHRLPTILIGLWICAAAQHGTSAVGENEGATIINTAPGTDLFSGAPVRKLRVELSPSAIARLRKDARKFVTGTVHEGTNVYLEVGIHLKGSVGSFRPIDDKPALTLDFSQFKKSQTFHGLRRIHLNNSVEDPSFINEQLASDLFNASGVPAPRVTHALVELNTRSLGLYVLKEGFTEGFLACHFQKVSGNLYEPEEGHDIDRHMKRCPVRAPVSEHRGLKALAAAALEPDAAKRWRSLQESLDLDRFLTFMALEVMICHRDGYCLARNNFRVYEEADNGKVVFFPHGMDQLLGVADLPWQPSMAGLAAKAVMETSQGRQAYRERFASLFTNVFRAEVLTNQVAQWVLPLRPFLPARDFEAIEAEAGLVMNRVVERQISLASQLSEPEPKPMEFTNGIGHLGGWMMVDKPVKGKMEQTQTPDGRRALYIMAGRATFASWRTRVVLDRGHYRFEGRGKVGGVKPLPQGVHQGAGLRIGGELRTSGSLTGSASWQTLQTEFQVDAPQVQVEFICELRASAGEAWFDLNSLHIIQVP